MAGALLMAHQDVFDFVLLENLVIDRKHRTSGIAEDVLDAMIDQRAHDHRCAGHLVWIVALVAHGWLRMRCCQRLGQFGFLVSSVENKKGPEEAPCTPPEFG